MIAIPNMEKPKGCWDCFNADCNHWGENGYDNSDDCPLIEIDDEAIDIAQDIIDGCKELKERINADIVRCEECRHRDSEFCQIRESMYGIKDNDFCSYGERRE